MTSSPVPDRDTPPAVLAAAAGWLTVSEAILAGLCHDLGNRVASMDALLQLMAEDDTGLMEDVVREVERLAGLVPTFRSLTGDMTAEAEPQMVAEVVERVRGLHARRRGLEVVTTECAIGEDLPPVLANRARLGRLLLLILDHVVSGSLEAGVRTVSVEVSGTPDEVTIRVWGEGAAGPHVPGEVLEILGHLAAWDGLTVVQDGGEVRVALPSLAQARAREA